MMDNTLTLVADIGGTNSRFALAQGAHVDTSTVRQILNADHATFRDALNTFLAAQAQMPQHACIAAAGPVLNNEVRLTNAHWTIRTDDLPCQAQLLNDVQAMGYALAQLQGQSGPRLVLNIGTGLNAAVLSRIGAQWHVPAAEWGFAALPHLEPDKAKALAACAEAFGAPVMEAVLSGTSLPQLHRSLTGQTLSAESITAAWPSQTLDLYLEVLGAFLADLALGSLPSGGIWLAGSLGCALYPHLERPAFRTAFLGRGPYRSLLETFEITALSDANAGLHGAALYSAQGQSAMD